MKRVIVVQILRIIAHNPHVQNRSSVQTYSRPRGYDPVRPSSIPYTRLFLWRDYSAVKGCTLVYLMKSPSKTQIQNLGWTMLTYVIMLRLPLEQFKELCVLCLLPHISEEILLYCNQTNLLLYLRIPPDTWSNPSSKSPGWTFSSFCSESCYIVL